MTEREARDEGAAQTRLIMEAVRQLRAARGWSAQRLAGEMTKVGVPWNADIVVNLEHGRRKSLRVHELLALAFVLDAARPLEVLVPGDEMFPVVPGVPVAPDEVRAWIRGDRGPLRQALAEGGVGRSVMESAADMFEQQGRPGEAAAMRRMAALLAVPGDGDDGQD